MITDPISDMLARIRNALIVGKAEVVMPSSKMKFAIAGILKKEGYIKEAEEVIDTFKQIKITLKYKDKEPAIQKIKRISKPGRRFYVKKDNLPIVLNDFGIAIISTPQGVMTNKEAKNKGLGGEVICEVY